MKAVERARISYSDGVTSSSAFLNHWLRDGFGFGESSFFSELTTMRGDWCGMYATSGGTAKGVFEITHHNFDSTASSLLLGSTNNLCKPSFVRSLI